MDASLAAFASRTTALWEIAGEEELCVVPLPLAAGSLDCLLARGAEQHVDQIALDKLGLEQGPDPMLQQVIRVPDRPVVVSAIGRLKRHVVGFGRIVEELLELLVDFHVPTPHGRNLRLSEGGCAPEAPALAHHTG